MSTKRRDRESSGGFHLVVPEIGRTLAGSISIQFRPAPPLRSLYGRERELAALIYEVAAGFERRFHELGVRWAVSPEVWNARIDIEFAEDDDDAEAAAEVVSEVLTALGIR